MKKLSFLSLFLCFCLFLSGCGVIDDIRNLKNLEREHVIPGYNVSVTAGASFLEASDAGAWDLQLTDKNAYFSMMVYSFVDLSEDQTPKSIYDYHNSDVFAAMVDSISVVEE